MAIGLEEQFGAVDAAAQFERLFLLDQVWTSYLQNSTKAIPGREITLLDRLAGEMSKLLRSAPDRAGYLEYVVTDNREECSDHYRQVLQWREGPNNRGMERLRYLVERHGGIVDYCRDGLQRITERSSLELEQLTAKMNVIKSGGFTPGDLSTQFICNLACGCIAGGIAAPPPANAIAIAAGLGMLLFVQSKGEDC